jgi:hypothetical protein
LGSKSSVGRIGWLIVLPADVHEARHVQHLDGRNKHCCTHLETRDCRRVPAKLLRPRTLYFEAISVSGLIDADIASLTSRLMAGWRATRRRVVAMLFGERLEVGTSEAGMPLTGIPRASSAARMVCTKSIWTSSKVNKELMHKSRVLLTLTIARCLARIHHGLIDCLQGEYFAKIRIQVTEHSHHGCPNKCALIVVSCLVRGVNQIRIAPQMAHT